MLTRTLNKSKVLRQLFSFLCFVVIIYLGLAGVVFGGISMLANALSIAGVLRLGEYKTLYVFMSRNYRIFLQVPEQNLD